MSCYNAFEYLKSVLEVLSFIDSSFTKPNKKLQKGSDLNILVRENSISIKNRKSVFDIIVALMELVL